VSQAVAQTANRPAGKSCTPRGYDGGRDRSDMSARFVRGHRPGVVCDTSIMAAWLLWLIAAGLFAAGEVVSLDLVLLMFAGGALGGMTVALMGGATVLQMVAFIAVSGVLLALVRPIAQKHLTERTPLQLDGVDTLIGRTARVTRDIDADGGRIRMGADEWTARSQHRGETFAVGATVRILQVDGATAIVGEAFE
jgi:membrane protein implicated in regulation of membrane protease activity